MQVIAFVLGEKKALENKHEKACTGVQVKLHKKLPTYPSHNPQFCPQSEVSVNVVLREG